MKSSFHPFVPAALAVAVLAACGGGDSTPNVKPAFLGPIQQTSYDGGTDDLLTAGLGKTGLASSVAPAYANPLAPTATELRRIFSYAFAPPAGPGGGVPDLDLHEIDGPFEAAGLAVTPVPIFHGPQPILGFRVGRFAYLTDCNAVPAASMALLGGLDVLVLDALRHRPHPTHFSLAEAVAVATQVSARETYFTHICHDLPHAATCASLPAGMALAFDRQVIMLDDVPGQPPPTVGGGGA